MSDTIEKSTVVWFAGLLFGAITTTATAVHFLHEHFITPMKVFESTQKVEKLTEKLNAQTDIVSELTTTKEKLDKAQLKLSQIEHSNLFIKGKIYPTTLEAIKIGDDISKVHEAYDKTQINLDDDTPTQPTLMVDLKNSVFYRITYSYDSKSKRIRSIAYMLDFDVGLGKDFLVQSVSNALGAPTALGDKGQYRWHSDNGVGIYILRDNYLLLDKGLVPRMWGGDRTK